MCRWPRREGGEPPSPSSPRRDPAREEHAFLQAASDTLAGRAGRVLANATSPEVPAEAEDPQQGEQASRMQKRAAERSPASSPAGAEAAGQLVLLAGDAVSLRPGGRAGLKQPRSLVYAPPMDHDPWEE